LPAQDLVLQHESEVSEDGTPRKVSIDIKAVAIGNAISQRVGKLVLGSTGLFSGFVAAGRNGRGIVFHITDLD
jgi:primosomal replication protein N